MSLIRDFVKDDSMPIYDNVEYAKGCERWRLAQEREDEED